jgi:nucleoside-diphosphate-sugar epimerase
MIAMSVPASERNVRASEKRVLLTGASGFVGRHAVEHLRGRGFEVHAVSSRRPPALPASDLADWHCADLLDPMAAQSLLKQVRPSHLLHLAWYAEHGKFWTSTENLRWVQASLRLLREFGEAGGRRAVMAGTCAEYDWSTGGPCSERLTPLAPSTLYGRCKHDLHSRAEEWCRRAGIQFAWGRIFFVHGPAEHPDRLVPSVARAVLAGQPAPCSHGRQLRDFLYSADVADAFAALLDSSVWGAVNVASGEPVSIREMVELVAMVAGDVSLVRLGALPARDGDPPELVADVRRLQGEVGWAPQLTLREGVEYSVEWWRRCYERKGPSRR